MCRNPLAYGQATATRIFLGLSVLLTGANDKESSSALPSGREGYEREERDSEERGEDEQDPDSGAADAEVRARPTGPGRRVDR